MPTAPAHAPDLLDREAPLRALCERVRALADHADAEGGCIALRSEAGVGKTSLLQALLSRTQGQASWLWGAHRAALHRRAAR